MAETERGFIPLHKAEEIGGDRVSFQLELPPYIEKDRIGVNVNRFDKACEIGGIRDLELHGAAGMDTSSTTPDVVGINSKGEAIAGKSSVEDKALDAVGGGETGPADHTHQMRELVYHMDLNLDEMSTRILAEGHPDGVRSVKPWVKELDRSTKKEVDWLGRLQLLRLVYASEVAPPLAVDTYSLMEAGYMGPVSYLMGDFDPQAPDPIRAATLLLAFNAALNIKDYFLYKYRYDHECGNEFRFSLFNGPQLDRALALAVYVRTRKFIKDLGSEKAS